MSKSVVRRPRIENVEDVPEHIAAMFTSKEAAAVAMALSDEFDIAEEREVARTRSPRRGRLSESVTPTLADARARGMVRSDARKRQ